MICHTHVFFALLCCALYGCALLWCLFCAILCYAPFPTITVTGEVKSIHPCLECNNRTIILKQGRYRACTHRHSYLQTDIEPVHTDIATYRQIQIRFDTKIPSSQSSTGWEIFPCLSFEGFH